MRVHDSQAYRKMDMHVIAIYRRRQMTAQFHAKHGVECCQCYHQSLVSAVLGECFPSKWCKIRRLQ